ncbi:hypothetical protein D3C72_1920090 [compost metagenome]
MGPRIADSLTASPQRPKNSASRVGGASRPTIARPADWLAPMHRPARLAASQNSPGPRATQTRPTMPSQPSRVSASVVRWPRRSCSQPNSTAPMEAVIFTTKISSSVSWVLKPMT